MPAVREALHRLPAHQRPGRHVPGERPPAEAADGQGRPLRRLQRLPGVHLDRGHPGDRGGPGGPDRARGADLRGVRQPDAPAHGEERLGLPRLHRLPEVPQRRSPCRVTGGKAEARPAEPTGEKCPVCGHDLVKRHGRFGEYVSCANYPNCRYKPPEAGDAHRRHLPGVQRGADPRAQGPLRPLLRLLALPRVHAELPRAARARSPARSAGPPTCSCASARRAPSTSARRRGATSTSRPRDLDRYPVTTEVTEEARQAALAAAAAPATQEASPRRKAEATGGAGRDFEGKGRDREGPDAGKAARPAGRGGEASCRRNAARRPRRPVPGADPRRSSSAAVTARTAQASTVFLASFVQGLVGSAFPASAVVLRGQGLTDPQYGSIFLPQMTLAAAGAMGAGFVLERVGAKRALALGFALMGALPGGAGRGRLRRRGLGLPARPPRHLAPRPRRGRLRGASQRVPAGALPVPQRERGVALHTVVGVGLAVTPVLAGAAFERGAWLAVPAPPRRRQPRAPARRRAAGPARAGAAAAGSPGRPARGAPALWLFLGVTGLYGLTESVYGNWAIVFLTEERGARGGGGRARPDRRSGPRSPPAASRWRPPSCG